MFSNIWPWRSWLVNPRHTSNSAILKGWYHCKNTGLHLSFALFKYFYDEIAIYKGFLTFLNCKCALNFFQSHFSPSKTTFKYILYRNSEHTGLIFWTMILVCLMTVGTQFCRKVEIQSKTKRCIGNSTTPPPLKRRRHNHLFSTQMIHTFIAYSHLKNTHFTLHRNETHTFHTYTLSKLVVISFKMADTSI